MRLLFVICSFWAAAVMSETPGDNLVSAESKAAQAPPKFKESLELPEMLPSAYWLLLSLLAVCAGVAFFWRAKKWPLSQSQNQSNKIKIIERCILDGRLTAYLLEIEEKKILLVRQQGDLCLTVVSSDVRSGD